MGWFENIVTGNDLANVRNQRSKAHIFQVIDPQLLPYWEGKDWIVDKELKKTIRIKKEKPADEVFEDRVWTLFAKMGFTSMNKNRDLDIPYEKNNPNLTQQIDVLAIDEDTVVIVECKSALTIDKKSNFKEVISAIQGNKAGIISTIRKKYPKRKFAYIFATQNYVLGDQDIDRLDEARITHFDEDVLQYYEELVRQLGKCAKYQLQGHLFINQTIENMKTVVPAVRGEMGGHTYFAFSIKPNTLLKMCHVLHRDKINKDNMPSYQRFVKRDRLIAIRSFIETGGYFPNSIVINIDDQRKIPFDFSELQCEESQTKLGLLHLPQMYHSAYIIDGQHRLYGYADTMYAETNTVPVVAFVGLKAEEQVELFMQINENQKSVPKKLRNVLNANLLLDSDNPSSKRMALRLGIAQALGEDRGSPLYGQISIDENDSNINGSITMEAISDGIKRGKYLNSYKKKGSEFVIAEHGLFDKNDNRLTREILYGVLKGCFEYFEECLNEEWQKASKGILLINNSIQAIIVLICDIIELLKTKGFVNPMTDKAANIVNEVKYYLDPLINYMQNLTSDQRDTIKKSYGSTGPVKVWRIYQKAISDSRSDFKPDGLDEWWRDNAKQFNDRSGALIRDIARYIKDDFRERLYKNYGDNWFLNGVPKPVYMKANKDATEKNYDVSAEDQKVTPWNCVTISQCQQIATYGSNWSDIFCDAYTMPNAKGKKGEKTDWMVMFDKIRTKDLMTYSVSETEYKFLLSVYDWLCESK